MGQVIWWILVFTLLTKEQPVVAKLDKSLYCSICRAVVEEINARIAESDPSKKVKVSSFRMGIDGKKHIVEKPYARSNEHLSKIFSEICGTMKDYGLRQLPDHKLTIVRVRSRATGEDLNVVAGATENIQTTFKGYCEALIEESEDDMWTLFKLEDLHTIESELCVKLAGMCTDEDLLKPFHGEDPPTQQEYTFSRRYEEPQEELYASEDGSWGSRGKVIEPGQDWDAQGRMYDSGEDWDAQGRMYDDWDAQGKVYEHPQDWDARGKIIEPVQEKPVEETVIVTAETNRTADRMEGEL